MADAHTLAQSITVQGFGLHTGAPASVELRPAPPGAGRSFVCGTIAIPARAAFVVDTTRSTTLGQGTARVRTVEHLLAALLLMEVDDVQLHIDGPEVPILDGAALAWCTAIAAAGVRAQGVPAPILRLAAPSWREEDASQFFLTPAPCLRAFAALSIPETPVTNRLVGGALTSQRIRRQIARARTYGLAAEVEALQAAGLAQGGSLDNAVVIARDGYWNAHVWPDEPAWHKVLDLVGDLALCGSRIQGEILAVRGGHRAHVALAAALAQLSPTPSSAG
jgi:UDP-3-O-[3-hydroxymyristoyl] N-acetylglucosamine deacetylase